MKKEIEFSCWSCDNTFKTKDWSIDIFKDDPHDIPEISIEAECPECGKFCYEYISLSTIVELIFELEEKLNELEKKVIK